MNLFNYLLVAFLVITQSNAYKTFKNVLVADDSNFEDLIHEKGKYTFVNFYSRQCSHCQKLGPKFEPLTELFNGTRIQIAQLEGRENKRIRKKEQIAGFPTLRLYAFDGTHLGSYTGDRSTEDMANFINAHTGVVPHWSDLKVLQVSTKKELDQVVKREKDVILAFVSPWLENWIGRYPFIERLASKLGSVKFVKVDATSEEAAELSSLFKVDTYPTIFHFTRGSTSKNFRRLEVNKDVEVDGQLIEEFLNNQIGQGYTSLKDLEIDKGDKAEQDDIQNLQKGFNLGLQRKVSPEQEEESYKRLREL